MARLLTKAQLATQSRMIPKIYADGENDDLPGIVAACEDKLVLYDGTLYAPGEALLVVGANCLLSRALFIKASPSCLREGFGSILISPSGIVATESADHATALLPEKGRGVTFDCCFFCISDQRAPT